LNHLGVGGTAARQIAKPLDCGDECRPAHQPLTRFPQPRTLRWAKKLRHERSHVVAEVSNSLRGIKLSRYTTVVIWFSLEGNRLWNPAVSHFRYAGIVEFSTPRTRRPESITSRPTLRPLRIRRSGTGNPCHTRLSQRTDTVKVGVSLFRS